MKLKFTFGFFVAFVICVVMSVLSGEWQVSSIAIWFGVWSILERLE
jgi:hypothetical protein